MEIDQSIALESILSQTWLMLERAAREQDSSLRLPVLATTGLDGKPNARTVVLRHVDRLQHTLYINTDRRAPKYTELRRQPLGMFVFYDPQVWVQLRIQTQISFHEDGELKQSAWSELSMEGRSVYMTEAPPGEAAIMATSGLPSGLRKQDPGEDDLRRGYHNFVVMESKAVSMDWLNLASPDHHRAAFFWSSGGQVDGRWLYP